MAYIARPIVRYASMKDALDGFTNLGTGQLYEIVDDGVPVWGGIKASGDPDHQPALGWDMPLDLFEMGTNSANQVEIIEGTDAVITAGSGLVIDADGVGDVRVRMPFTLRRPEFVSWTLTGITVTTTGLSLRSALVRTADPAAGSGPRDEMVTALVRSGSSTVGAYQYIDGSAVVTSQSISAPSAGILRQTVRVQSSSNWTLGSEWYEDDASIIGDTGRTIAITGANPTTDTLYLDLWTRSGEGDFTLSHLKLIDAALVS